MTADEKEQKVRAAIAHELGQIARRRYVHNLGTAPPSEPAPVLDAAPYENARRQELVGLTLSGGGIRSATFALGVLQGLAGLGLLKYIDYLSTVSGGGYLGGWFTAWVRRCRGGLAAVERQLRPSWRAEAAQADPGLPRGTATEPRAIFHLRRFSNYLSPRLGLLSADVWVLWATYLRNLLVCQLVLLPATVGVLLIARLFLLLYHPATPEFIADALKPADWDTATFIEWQQWALGGAVLLFWFVAALFAFLGSGWVRPDDVPGVTPADRKRLTSKGMLWQIVVPVVLTAILFCWVPALRIYTSEHDPGTEDQSLVLGLPWLPAEDSDAVGEPVPADAADRAAWTAFKRYVAVRPSVRNVFLCFALVPAAVVLVAYLLALPFHRRWRDVLSHLFWACVACIFGGIHLFIVSIFLTWLCAEGPGELTDYVHARAAARVTTFGPPLVVGVIVLTIYLGVALMRNRLGEELREWWSSLCAWLMIFAVLWMAVNGLALYAAAAVLWVGPWAKVALGSGWLITVAGGVLAGGAASTDAQTRRSTLLDGVARLAPSVFVSGLLIGLALLLHAVLDSPPNWERGLDTAEWMRRLEPLHAPIRLTQTSTDRTEAPEAPSGKDGPPARRVKVKESTEVTARDRVFDAPTVTSRVYWLSMFNTNPMFVPLSKYDLDQEDIRYLQEKRGLSREEAKALTDVRPPKAPIRKPDEFLEIYRSGLEHLKTTDKAMPGEVTQEEVLQIATDADLIAFKPGLLFVKLGAALLVCLFLFLLAAFRVDVNLFSLHALYGNRLMRCYLGASHSDRSPDPITGLDPGDDLKLADLRLKTAPHAEGYDGPFLLVNTALNLVSGDELAWQERKAESFTLSPLACGSPDTGYCDAAVYSDGLALSTAITISGAAASPNAGYHSSAPVTALLTVFNARLGAWLGNPRRQSRWRDRSPRGGFVYLLKELFGRTTSDSAYIYLSDGGHFENLGAYELIRRRCRYVVIADAGCDGKHMFEDLGNLIRKCRTDFGISIETNLTPLRRAVDGGLVHGHCAFGTIHYEDVDAGATPGTLVYLKPSLSGDEPADVLHYAAQHPEFPHETTANQFFGESQFESYRALGQHIAEAVFHATRDRQWERAAMAAHPADAEERRRHACRGLFEALIPQGPDRGPITQVSSELEA